MSPLLILKQPSKISEPQTAKCHKGLHKIIETLPLSLKQMTWQVLQVNFKKELASAKNFRNDQCHVVSMQLCLAQMGTHHSCA